MFGYIRPYVPELKVYEYEQFKSCYCGLCHALGKKYGLSTRFILNYDFVLLTMLLWDEDKKCTFDRKRCIVSPCKRKCVCVSSSEYDKAAAMSIILSYWKLDDSVRDDGFFKGIPSRFGKLFLRRGYKKARAEYPEFDNCVREQIEALSAFEKANEKSLDKTADTFAMILSKIADLEGENERKRVFSQLLYHIGRWIYIADAVNDLQDDMKSNSYNPVVGRFDLSLPQLSDEDKNVLNTTMSHSENIIISAFGLLKENPWASIIKNILYLGMPDVRKSVIDGTYKKEKAKRPK